MTIAVIGTGNMGSGFAKLFASTGEKVVIGARDPAKASRLAQDIGGSAEGGGIAAAVKLADVILVAVWCQHFEESIRAAGDLSGKVIIDISNPVTEDFKSLRLGHTSSAAEELQKLAPHAKIVKAFNTVFAQLLPSEARSGRVRVQTFVAADDETAKKTVFDLAAKGGFEPVDSGPLSNARFLEPMGELNIHFGFFLGQGTGVAPAWVKAAA
ncbi:NADPH-dependent F420 reductase [Methylobacterium trifolii]|uniref:Pyrroline-5-carboxylate reductase n=1 Tax=Methylobacterium trifolii TaxID=1003092 RepID=A0ABQ4TVH6_9HYPH|nr:NADPH-dependent F420 reductase [Methylobacterium trifolii]GJE58581.1 Pyrroline-5-carboxylate reductase [Methylobacterium trifolii]